MGKKKKTPPQQTNISKAGKSLNQRIEKAIQNRLGGIKKLKPGSKLTITFSKDKQKFEIIKNEDGSINYIRTSTTDPNKKVTVKMIQKEDGSYKQTGNPV